MKITVKVEGLRELDAALGKLPKSIGKAVLRRIARRALAPFDRRWRANAPVLTGALRRSGGVGTRLTRRQARLQRAEDRKLEEGRASIVMYAGASSDPAAVTQEFGTHDQPAQPFMRPAWDETSTEALRIVRDELWGEIQKAAARLAAKAARLAVKG